MKFSLIIPTKNRQKTAIQAVKSAVFSNYNNIEIIVTDGSDDNSLGMAINKLNDGRVSYFHHHKSLSMRDNWEFGVSKASGDYVSIIGDDDALMPDGFCLAAEILKISETDILHTKGAIYKWPDYQLINRRNYISLKLPQTVRHIKDPRKVLRQSYELNGRPGTGPGIYRGIISLKFLNELKLKRGSYFKDENADFDSGFCTLLYADSYLVATYPIFLSGHCGESNSGAVNDRSAYHQGVSRFMNEATSCNEDILWEELDKIVTLDVAVISAMRRFLPEVNKIIKGKKVKLKKQNMFNLIAGGLKAGFETTTFKADIEILKKIAKKWNVSSEAIPSRKTITMGLLNDKGINKSSITEDKPIQTISVDGNALGVKDILDAIKVVDSLSVDWVILLKSLGFTKSVIKPERRIPVYSLENITKELQSEKYETAQKLLEENITFNPFDAASLLLLGVMYYNQSDYKRSIPNLARSLSIEFNIQGFDAYFQSLIKSNEFDCARLVLNSFKEDISQINIQLFEHCLGLLEMSAGNYNTAANIFKKIRPEIDKSLYYYCAAYSKFLKGETINADSLVKQALDYGSNKSIFLELEAKIEACL